MRNLFVAKIVLVSCALFASCASAPPDLSNPRLVIRKSDRLVELYDGGTLVKRYPMALGFAPEGDKEVEGDGRTPTGDFYIFIKNEQSRFHRSLGVSYPSVADAERGLRNGLISNEESDAIGTAIREMKMPPQNTRLGGEIYLHGGGAARDWTWGCIAVSDADIAELFDIIPVGAKISILP